MEQNEININSKESLESKLNDNIKEENSRFEFEKSKQLNETKSTSELIDESNVDSLKIDQNHEPSKLKISFYNFMMPFGVDLYAKDIKKRISNYENSLNFVKKQISSLDYSLNSNDSDKLGLKLQKKNLKSKVTLYKNNIESNYSAISILDENVSLLEVKLDDAKERNNFDLVENISEKLFNLSEDINSYKSDLVEKETDYFYFIDEVNNLSEKIEDKTYMLSQLVRRSREFERQINRQKNFLKSKDYISSYSQVIKSIDETINQTKNLDSLNNNLEEKQHFIEQKLVSKASSDSNINSSSAYIQVVKQKSRLERKQNQTNNLSKVRDAYVNLMKK